MREKDWYKVLRVSPTASDAEIKKAYRKRALETHPDKNRDKAGAEEEFKAVSEAYSVLSDPTARRAYDASSPDEYGDSYNPGGGDPFAATTRGDFGGDPFATRFGTGFDPTFGRSYEQPRSRGDFSLDDARAQFDRFFGTQSPWEGQEPKRSSSVIQISTIKRADGSMESLRREKSATGTYGSYEHFNQGHVLHGGRGHVTSGAGPAAEALPFGGDVQRAAAARDRKAIREIMTQRQRRELAGRPRGTRAIEPSSTSSHDDDGDEALARRLASSVSDDFWK